MSLVTCEACKISFTVSPSSIAGSEIFLQSLALAKKKRLYTLHNMQKLGPNLLKQK